MNTIAFNPIRVLVTIVLGIALLSPSSALAHCDGLDGPVVKAARNALDTGNANLVLIWVQERDEAEIRKAFDKTLAVRGLSPEARELADTSFFETLVRIHRAGEGASYTGLKPAGRDLGPAIPAADKAIEDGVIEPVLKLVTSAADHGVRERFQRVVSLRKFDPNDVAAGREYVEAYVTFIHYVEGIHGATESAAHGHLIESEEPAPHERPHSASEPSGAKGDQTMKFQVPQSLKEEHEELHAMLVKATEAGGKVGPAARTVARLLHPHFVKEEEYAMPPLGLLSSIAKGDVTPQMKGALAMTERLKADLPHMLDEHKAIVAALKDLTDAAAADGKPEWATFAKKLTLHARTEEEVLYPAAILVGEYLRLKLNL